MNFFFCFGQSEPPSPRSPASRTALALAVNGVTNASGIGSLGPEDAAATSRKFFEALTSSEFYKKTKVVIFATIMINMKFEYFIDLRIWLMHVRRWVEDWDDNKIIICNRSLFPKDDDSNLKYLDEDGISVEPFWYLPVIPMVLVNCCEGIGTGWSTFVPNYNPRDIVANLRRLLQGDMIEPMHPWYRGFRGTIEKGASKECTYTVNGIIKFVSVSW